METELLEVTRQIPLLKESKSKRAKGVKFGLRGKFKSESLEAERAPIYELRSIPQ